jgi:hypothetical protein
VHILTLDVDLGCRLSTIIIDSDFTTTFDPLLQNSNVSGPNRNAINARVKTSVQFGFNKNYEPVTTGGAFVAEKRPNYRTAIVTELDVALPR